MVEIYKNEYAAETFINIHEKSPNSLGPNFPLANNMDFYVNGRPGSISVTVKLNTDFRDALIVTKL